MQIMGYKNINHLYDRSREGRFNVESRGNSKLDGFALAVMQYMAARSSDWDPDRTYHAGDVPPRCYWGGWDAIIDDFGMVMPTREQALDSDVDKEELFARRHKSSLARLSKTGRWLEQQGLIKRIVPANTKLGRNAFWLLMIGDDFENEQVEQAARTALGLGVFGGR